MMASHNLPQRWNKRQLQINARQQTHSLYLFSIMNTAQDKKHLLYLPILSEESFEEVRGHDAKRYQRCGGIDCWNFILRFYRRCWFLFYNGQTQRLYDEGAADATDHQNA